VPARGDVYLVRLDPTRGSEIRKTRPCLVVSPDELNEHLRTVIVAPMDDRRANLSVAGFVSVSKVAVDSLRRTSFVPSIPSV
jgi:mRNA-degrading endonuclease toxin of MazEF toxin-antitoxin module